MRLIMIIMAIVLFVVDFIVFGIFNSNVTVFLLMYLVFSLMNRETIPYTVLALYLMQNSVVVGRFGTSLVYILLLIYYMPRIKALFSHEYILPYVLMFTGFILVDFVSRCLILGSIGSMPSTAYFLFGNMILMVISLKIRFRYAGQSLSI